MSAVRIELEAQTRVNLRKGASRRLRREEKTLGIVYGGKKVPTPITIEHRHVLKAIESEVFFTQIINLKIEYKLIINPISCREFPPSCRSPSYRW